MKTIMFDKNATYWENDINDNLCFVRMRGRYISDLLTVRGYLYMNQIYEHFGIKWNPEDLNELFFADNGPIYFEFEHVGGNNILIHIKH